MAGTKGVGRRKRYGKPGQLPRDWAARRQAVFARDEWRCQVAGPRCTVHATEVDHIRRREHGGSHAADNLRAVCHTCHVELTRRPSVPFPWAT